MEGREVVSALELRIFALAFLTLMSHNVPGMAVFSQTGARFQSLLNTPGSFFMQAYAE
jgi:hypothetical protein